MDTTKSPADRGKCQQGLKMSEISINLSVEHSLDSHSPSGTNVPPPPTGGVFPNRGAFGKQGKLSSTAKASPP